MAIQEITVAVIGSGDWGSAFGGALVAADCRVIFWDRTPRRAAQAAAAATADALPACAVTEWEEVTGADVIIVAVSSGGFAAVLQQLGAVQAPVFWLTKGFEPASGVPLYQLAAATLPSGCRYGVISGPSFAAEARRGLPLALSLACSDADTGKEFARRLHRPHLRLYAEDDVIGVCVGGALKNVIAIAAGICDGLALGENARAALITRGLAEMRAINQMLGGKVETLLGLSGVGDLLLSCCSDLSRNRRLGLRIAAQGVAQAMDGTTCEGVAAAAAAAALSARAQLDVPIIRAVSAVLAGELAAAEAVQQLLARAPR